MDDTSRGIAANKRNRTRGGGSKLTRTETVTVRFDPKLRYLGELASRIQHRTLSSYIEFAVADSLTRQVIWQGEEYPGAPHTEVKISDVADSLWDVFVPDRFGKLAVRFPHLLNHIEQIIWKFVRENSFFWKTNERGRTLDFVELRAHWDALNKVARGEADKSILPGAEPDSEDDPQF